MRYTLYQSGLEAFGRKEHYNQDWFEANWQEMEPVVGAKRAAHLAHVSNPRQATRDALRAARRRCQNTARRCANDYWMKLSEKIQCDADCGNTGGMYAGIKNATGPSVTKSVPLKSKSGEFITDQKKQLDRWVEYYLELHSTQNVVTDAVLGSISLLPTLVELGEEPSMQELSKAIDFLSPPKRLSLEKTHLSLTCTTYSYRSGAQFRRTGVGTRS